MTRFLLEAQEGPPSCSEGRVGCIWDAQFEGREGTPTLLSWLGICWNEGRFCNHHARIAFEALRQHGRTRPIKITGGSDWT